MDMRTFPVRVQGGCNVHIGRGLLGRCGELVKSALGPCRAAVVTDKNVERLYLAPVLEGLCAAGFDACSLTLPAGERYKQMETLGTILEFLAGNRLTRADCVLALGGGVVGDTAGFAAGCYLRGVRYAQLPTTLLAAVDSSVGGKTAVNLSAGKNLAGLFYQPSLVVCDPDCFATLPADEFANGAAEAIKTGILGDEPLFCLLESGDVCEDADEVVARCVAYKASIVEADERDGGPRNLLNLGHTVGHAIELLSGYAVPHGHAVAIGLYSIARAAERTGFAEAPLSERIRRTLIRNELPFAAPYSAEQLAEAALSDKKRRGGSITLALPRRIGACELVTMPADELLPLLRAGTEERP